MTIHKCKHRPWQQPLAALSPKQTTKLAINHRLPPSRPKTRRKQKHLTAATVNGAIRAQRNTRQDQAPRPSPSPPPSPTPLPPPVLETMPITLATLVVPPTVAVPPAPATSLGLLVEIGSCTLSGRRGGGGGRSNWYSLA